MIDGQLDAVQAVIEKLGGVSALNEYLQKIEAASRYERRTESASYYELVTRVIRRQLIGYCEAKDLARWHEGEAVCGYEVMIVGDTDRIILPASGFGFLFKPQKGDYFQIRSAVRSKIIGLTLYYYFLRSQTDWFISEKREAEKIARQPWEKQTYEEPIGFLWGSLGSQSVRDWDGERRQAQYQYEMGQKAERLTGIIQMMRETLEKFMTIRELLESTPQLKKILEDI